MENSLFSSFFRGVLNATAICAIAGVTLVCSAHADEGSYQSADKTSKLSHSFTFDGAYYPKSAYVKGEDHFAKPTGAFDGILAKATWKSAYTISTPLGSGPLLSSANVELAGSLEVSPLSIRPIASVTFSPLPFLAFDAGASIGSGWNLLGFEGMCEYQNDHYKNLTPFTRYYHDHWVSATLQFDTGALIEGDWSHVVMLVNYQMIYKGIIGVDDGKLWAWQTTEGYVNGLGYNFIALLGYQMPTFVNMVGFMAEMYGNYRNSDFGEYANTYGKFMTVRFNLFANLKLNETNSLLVDARVSSRRSFATDHKKGKEEPHLLQTGREWFFDCIALSWVRNF